MKVKGSYVTFICRSYSGTEKQDFMHAYPFLRVTSVVASHNFNPSLLECFTFLREERGRLRWMKCQNSGRFELFKRILKKTCCVQITNFFCVLWIEKKVKLFRLWALYNYALGMT